MNNKILNALSGVTDLARHATHLENEHELLAKGAANQARIIRELRDELAESNVRAELAEYQVEFLKSQGRKTRLKHRAEVKSLKGRCSGRILEQRIEHLQDELTTARGALLQERARSKLLRQMNSRFATRFDL